MTGEERRRGIEQILSQSPRPVSAAALARRFGVSRQIIVGDVALLREIGADAVLIGEALMRAPDRRAMLARLRGGV